MCPVLAGPGLLDLREHPCVCRRHDGSGGLHHPQILHPAGRTWVQLSKIMFYNPSCSDLSLPATDALTWRGCVSGGRRVWEETSEACHPVPLHQLARFRGAFHSYWHAQVPEKSEELQPTVCRSHRGALQVSGAAMADICCSVWTVCNSSFASLSAPGWGGRAPSLWLMLCWTWWSPRGRWMSLASSPGSELSAVRWSRRTLVWTLISWWWMFGWVPPVLHPLFFLRPHRCSTCSSSRLCWSTTCTETPSWRWPRWSPTWPSSMPPHLELAAAVWRLNSRSDCVRTSSQPSLTFSLRQNLINPNPNDLQKLTSIKIQNDKMRTGNLPANMKKNRVLQIIPCEWSYRSNRFLLNREVESGLMIISVSDRRVQQGDHSSQERRGEHRLRQCLVHWCECTRTDHLGYLYIYSGVFNSCFISFLCCPGHRVTVRRTPTWRARALFSTPWRTSGGWSGSGEAAP